MADRSLIFNLIGRDRASRALNRVAEAAGRTGVTLAKVGAAAGSAIPAVANLAAVAAAVAPAAGVAATGVLAMVTASAALKIGMSGVSDAAKLAFDPAKSKEFNEALKKLSPNARAFVLQLKSMSPALDRLKKHVQDRLFERLDTAIARAGKVTLPIFKTHLGLAASALNLMGRQTLNTATRLGKSGALGQALTSATRGLFHLKALPATVVQGLVQIGAAAGPSFERLAAAGGRGLERLSAKMADAFASGEMQRSIETAVGLVKQLASVGVNVGRILGNIFGAAQASGGGLISALQSITGELAKVTASAGVQSALRTLFTTMGTIGKTAAVLLGEALRAIGPVLTALGPPVQVLVRSLGTALTPIIRALGPILAIVARSVGSFVTALSPLLPIVGRLLGQGLRALTPVLSAAGAQLGLIGRTIAMVAGPALRALGPVLIPLIGVFARLAVTWTRMQTQLLVQLRPSLVSLGQSFGKILVAIQPLVGAFVRFVALGLRATIPLIPPLVAGIAKLVGFFARMISVSVSFTSGVVRAFQWLYDRLIGHSIIPDLINGVVRWFTSLPGRAARALASLGSRIAGMAVAAGARLLGAVRSGITKAVTIIKGLPGRARSALGNLGRTLLGKGRDLLYGFLNGAKSVWRSLSGWWDKAPGKVRGAVGKVTGTLRAKGRDILFGFLNGAKSVWRTVSGWWDKVPGKVRSAVGGVTKTLHRKGRDILYGFLNGAKSVWRTVSGWWDKSPGRTRSAVGNVRRTLHGKGREILSGFLNGAKSFWHAYVSFWDKAPGRTRTAIGRVTSTLRGKGRDLVSGLLSGASARIKAIGGWARNIKNKIVGAIKSVFGIHSPSRVMASLGGHMMSGLLKGMLSGKAILGSAVKGIFHSVTDIFTKAPKLMGELFGALGGGGGGGAKRWSGVVLQALKMLGQPASLLPVALRRMNQESGGNPRAINKWDINAKHGDPSRGLMQTIGCVTVDTVILTRRGWLKHDQVRPGDETIGYNPTTGMTEWTPITAVHHYEDAEVWRIGNRNWKADVTPNHRWWSDTRVTRRPESLTACPECGWAGRPGRPVTARSISTHLGRVHGVKQHAEAITTYRGEFLTTDQLGHDHRIRVAARADTPRVLDITAHEAAIIGWALGDGSIGPDGDITLWQSKPEGVAALQQLLADVPHGVSVRQRKAHYHPAYAFRLRRAYARDLLARSQVRELGPERFVLSLDAAQRKEFLDAMVASEGHTRDGFTRIAQVNGPTQEAIKLAVYLEGWRPTFVENSAEKNGYKPAGLVGMARPHIAPSMFDPHEVLPRQTVWCVTTELGTWTAEQNGLPFLTGNSTFNAYAGKLRGLGIYNPLANIYASMRYALSRYGSLARAYNRPGGYASGTTGAAPGWAWVGERGPELVRMRGGEEVLSHGDSMSVTRGYARGTMRFHGRTISIRGIGGVLNKGFLEGLTGTMSQIRSVVTRTTNAIRGAFKKVRTSFDNRLISRINKQGGRLQKLAGQRDALTKQITDAQTLAGELTSSARGGAALSNLGLDTGVTGWTIRQGMSQKLNRIRRFTGVIKTLAKMGLSKGLLRQILEMGPDEGYTYALALQESGREGVASVNKLQSGIYSATTSLGRIGADRLYDSGKNASRGFLEGLKSQRKSITALMWDIARSMSKSLRRALKSRSPSQVMHAIGVDTMAGLTGGMGSRLPAVAAVAGQAARTAADGMRPVARPAVARGVGGAQAVHIQVDVHGATDPIAVAREIRKALLELKRSNGGKELGIA